MRLSGDSQELTPKELDQLDRDSISDDHMDRWDHLKASSEKVSDERRIRYVTGQLYLE